MLEEANPGTSIDDLFTGRHFDRGDHPSLRAVLLRFIGLPGAGANLREGGIGRRHRALPRHSFAAVWASRTPRRAITEGGNVVPMRVVS
jgi:hypothetical protein